MCIPRIILASVCEDVALYILDTYNRIENKLWGGIHPRNKQTPSLRLAIAGFNVAYGFTNYPTRGPWPMTVKISGKYFITSILQP